MTTADFKAKIARIMRERETGKRYSVIGASRADPSVVVTDFLDEVSECDKVKHGRKKYE